MDIKPYLTFNGDCTEALKFYAEVLGGEVIALQKFSEIPGESPFGPDLGDKVMHAQMRIGDTIVMASDHAAPEPYEPPRAFSLSIAFDETGEASRIFDQLAEAGEVTMPFAKTFWAAGFGMCRDRFGMPWMVNCDNPT